MEKIKKNKKETYSFFSWLEECTCCGCKMVMVSNEIEYCRVEELAHKKRSIVPFEISGNCIQFSLGGYKNDINLF